MNFKTLPVRQRNTAGFTLIEVMIAVVVLATGLLALAAMQGALARNAADAKARGAIMAALTSRMAELRQAPPSTTGTTPVTTTFTRTNAAWVNAAALQAGADDLQVVQTVQTYRWSAGAYVTSAVALPSSTLTRARLAASWTNADGTAKTLTVSSDLSDMIYGSGRGYNNPAANSSALVTPVIRQQNPSNIPGVIPIASGNQATAASNPQPILVGRDDTLVGTRFDVLTYIPEGATAKISKRFDTELIKCRCKYGAVNVNEAYGVAGEAQFPAVWNGDTYAVYKPSGGGVPYGRSLRAGEDPDYSGRTNGNPDNSGRLQSTECTECCRDHHDQAASPVKFDPEASLDPLNPGVALYTKYDLNSAGTLVPQTNTSSGTYVASCRVVKTGGLWRTTADMYARQFGLLKTSDVGVLAAKSGVPDTSTVGTYQQYVKDYLGQLDGSAGQATPPNDGQSRFDAITALQAPSSIAITLSTALSEDWRYLHARGLYVDHLESAALAAIAKAIAKCPSGTAIVECILPVVPFTTINMTEMVEWTPSSSILQVNNKSLLDFDIYEPMGGRTKAIGNGSERTISKSLLSNSGVAVGTTISGAVDRQGDLASITDNQPFLAGTGGAGGGTQTPFKVRLLRDFIGEISNIYAPRFTTAAEANKSCVGGANGTGSKDYDCSTGAPVPAAAVVVLTGYGREGTSGRTTYRLTGSCSKADGTIVQVTKDLDEVPVYFDYNITAATIGTTNLSWVTSGTDGTRSDTTTVTVPLPPGIAASSLITVTATQQGSGPTHVATIRSCTTNGGENQINDIVWNKPWL